MPRAKWAVYDENKTPVMLITGFEDTARQNMPQGGAIRVVPMETEWLEQVPPLEETDAEAG